MKTKIKDWLHRYLPAEVLATIGALFGAFVGNFVFHNQIITAYLAAFSENIGYYGIMIYKELKQIRATQNTSIVKSISTLIRNLVVEFGPSEYLDSLLVRPFSMYFFPRILGDLAIGVIVAKFFADFIFYIPTIILYELRKAVFKDQAK